MGRILWRQISCPLCGHGAGARDSALVCQASRLQAGLLNHRWQGGDQQRGDLGKDIHLTVAGASLSALGLTANAGRPYRRAAVIIFVALLSILARIKVAKNSRTSDFVSGHIGIGRPLNQLHLRERAAALPHGLQIYCPRSRICSGSGNEHPQLSCTPAAPQSAARGPGAAQYRRRAQSPALRAGAGCEAAIAGAPAVLQANIYQLGHGFFTD